MDSQMAKPMSVKLSGVVGGWRVSDLGKKNMFVPEHFFGEIFFVLTLSDILLQGTDPHKIFPKFWTGAATSIHSAIYRWFAPQSPVKILGQGEREQLG